MSCCLLVSLVYSVVCCLMFYIMVTIHLLQQSTENVNEHKKYKDGETQVQSLVTKETAEVQLIMAHGSRWCCPLLCEHGIMEKLPLYLSGTVQIFSKQIIETYFIGSVKKRKKEEKNSITQRKSNQYIS